MATDDDFQSFSLLHQTSSSPQFQPRRLKRLKKRNEDAVVQFPPKINQRSSPKLAAAADDDDDDDLNLFPKVDFAELLAMEAALDDSNPDDSIQPVHSVEKSRSGDGCSSVNTMEGSLELGGDEFLIDVEERRDAKRVLNFDDDDESEKLEAHGVAQEEKITENNPIMEKEEVLEKGNSRNDRDEATKEEKSIEKKGKKRSRGDSAGDAKPGKRKLEKERKEHLKQLHAESQRLLRESTDTAFKPTKVMAKSLSDVLEKMRQRKMQFTKKTATVYSAVSSDINRSADAPEVEQERERDAEVKSVGQHLDDASQQPEISDADQLIADCLDVDKSTASVTLPSCDNLPSQKVPDEKAMPVLQPLLDDTEDLFVDSHTKDNEDEKLDSQEDSPLEEAFVPSLNVLNMKFDSDDTSSEDDNDKENVDPQSQRSEDSPRRGDPVKAFLDEEAEEEDDSDHDMLRFPENEDDDMEDIEELRDLIATNFEEKPSDNERRNELHQKWLEQQDAAGTDDLLQKLKVGNTSIGLEQEEEQESEEIEDHDPVDEDNAPQKCSTRVHLKKAKEMISRMFGEKDEVYISDEDEEIEKKLVQQRLTVRTEVSVSSVQDESSREVSGLIKKLNIAPENRKKAKTSLYFDSVFKAGNDNGFAKSSFVGRISTNSLPSYHKKSSGSARSFIFGRDDSNSRNSMPPSDDSEDAVLKGNHSFKPSKSLPTRTQAKYSSSQSKKGTAESSETKKSQTSLFEVLKRSSSMKTGFSNGEDRLDLAQVISTFKIPKKF